MKRINMRWLVVILVAAMPFVGVGAQDLMTDTWVATDGLGRVMPTSAEVGLPKTDKDRKVGIFYVTWHTQWLHEIHKPYSLDVTKVLNEDHDARFNGESPAWKGVSFHWGEPEYGYFLSRDRYVIRHDISMLADAGVDVLIFDVTNAVCYFDEWDVIFEELAEMKRLGNTVPQVCFWTFNGAAITVTQQVYERYYKPRRYEDLWYCRDGKPLLLCNKRPTLDANGGGAQNPNPNYDATAKTDVNHPHYGDPDYAEQYYKDYTREVKDMFTMRNMWWGYSKWGGQPYVGTEDNWCFGYEMQDPAVSSLKPEQRASLHNGRYEEMAVTPAQHPVSITGKSWRVDTKEPTLNEIDMPDSAYVPWLGRVVKHPERYGIYFQDRWDEALQVDPEFIYLNDWNEWTAGKYVIGKAPGQDTPGPTTFLGRSNNTFYFVDQYNEEFNRTIAPAKGPVTDNYYMQMVQNIRRYKGVRALPVARGTHRITVDGRFEEWADVAPVYRDTRGDVLHRSHDGYGGLHYENTSGRNDIVESRVAISGKDVAFYVKTADALTPATDPNWMLLLIDADADASTGWEGYDYIINYGKRSVGAGNRPNGQTEVMAYDSASSQWRVVGQADFAMRGNEMELRVAQKMVGIKRKGGRMSFDFKWADNPADLNSIISICTDGDAAPNRRFNYRFTWNR